MRTRYNRIDFRIRRNGFSHVNFALWTFFFVRVPLLNFNQFRVCLATIAGRRLYRELFQEFVVDNSSRKGMR